MLGGPWETQAPFMKKRKSLKISTAEKKGWSGCLRKLVGDRPEDMALENGSK